jgi:predicted ATPase/DNA-binding SARP family transcriptional activator
VHLQILGDVLVGVDGDTRIALRPQTRRLLVLLAIADGASVPADRIVEHVLDGNPERSALRKAVSRLRAEIGDLAERSGDGYLLRVDGLDLDSRRFEAARREAQTAAPGDRVELLTAALGLWRGRALAEFADESWAAPTAARLETARGAATEDLAEALIDNGRAADAIAMLEVQIAAAPHSERPVALMMRALADTGRVAEALRCSRRFSERLRADTGVSPTAQLTNLEFELLTTDDDRRPPTPIPPVGNLVRPLATFVGRDAEVATIAESVRSRRLTTIKGVGGVGKTRLATEVGWSLIDHFPDGVWFIDLVPVSDEATIVHAVASVIGTHSEVGSSLIDVVIDDLRDRRALLIVDNCEHVHVASAAVVSAIVTRCPELRVLVTSRVPLGVAGEHVSPVGPLTEVDSTELFRVRASDLDEIGPSDLEPFRSAIGEICRRLDGLPLAIELAAARTRSFTPAEIVARLDDRYQLVSADVGRTTRHQSMQDVIDWSYRLLDDRERRLFEAVSIFPGSFGLAAVEAVCQLADDDGSECAASLASLVDKSMVVATRASTGARFHVLVTIGQFARDRLDERDEADGTDERARLRRAHTRHYARVATIVSETWQRDDQREATQLMAAEWDNFRAALVASVDDGDTDAAAQLVIDLVPALLMLRPEHAEWVRTVFPLVHPPDTLARALYQCAAYWAEAMGEPDEVVSLVESGRRWWPKDPHLASVLTRALLMLDRGDEAMDAAQISLSWVSEHRARGSLSRLDAAHFVATASGCALVACPSETVELARLSADIAREVGGVDAEARAQLAAGNADLATGQPDAALTAFRRALELGRGIGGLEREAWYRVATASALGGTVDAERAFLDALRFLRRDRMWMYTMATLERLTIYWIDSGNIEAASVLLGYLDAQGWGASVDASDRARAKAVAAADSDRTALRLRGAMMDRNQLVVFALDELETATASLKDESPPA